MDTLPRVFLNTLRLYPKENFMLVKKAGIYHPLSTAAFGKQVRHFALGLRELGVFPEDKVVLLSENRPEWVMADLGVV